MTSLTRLCGAYEKNETHLLRNFRKYAQRDSVPGDSVWNWKWPKSAINMVNMDGLEWKRSKYNKMTQQFLKWAESLAAKKAQALIADSPDRFAEYVVQLFRDRTLRTRISSQAHAIAREHYDWRNKGRELERALSQIMATRTQRSLALAHA